MDIVDRIRNGDFKTKLPYVSPDMTKEQQREMKEKWRIDTRRLEREEFKKALLEELDIVGHPKADDLFDLAWDGGHSGGLSDVALYAEELVVLVQP